MEGNQNTMYFLHCLGNVGKYYFTVDGEGMGVCLITESWHRENDPEYLESVTEKPSGPFHCLQGIHIIFTRSRGIDEN